MLCIWLFLKCDVLRWSTSNVPFRRCLLDDTQNSTEIIIYWCWLKWFVFSSLFFCNFQQKQKTDEIICSLNFSVVCSIVALGSLMCFLDSMRDESLPQKNKTQQAVFRWSDFSGRNWQFCVFWCPMIKHLMFSCGCECACVCVVFFRLAFKTSAKQQLNWPYHLSSG